MGLHDCVIVIADGMNPCILTLYINKGLIANGSIYNFIHSNLTLEIKTKD